ncbi:MAG: hypothetical protein AAGI38_05095, partial [Bacteroidota bacterium]
MTLARCLFILLFSVVLFSGNLQGQNARVRQKISKITQEIANAPDNAEKVVTLHRASRELFKIAPKKALTFAKEAVDLANRYQKNQGLAYTTLGSRYINLSQYPNAIRAFERA